MLDLRTIVGVLAGHLSHGVSDLLANISDRFGSQAGHQLLADRNTLLIGQAEEDLLDIARDGVLAGLGRNPSEKYGGESTGLLGNKSRVSTSSTVYHSRVFGFEESVVCIKHSPTHTTPLGSRLSSPR